MRTNGPVIEIRAAGAGDASTMAAIHAACFEKCWDAAEIGQFLDVPGCLALLASIASAEPPQGFLIVRSAGDEADILTLAVDPSCRRLGLARALLGAATASLREAGSKRLFLEVDEGNSAARGLYQSLGAVVVGRRPRYYEHGADAAIFSLAL
ncbi:GNAT family N-acetyltransferase [Methyloceanibacter sp.]|uniref:GNAT family N-acetyltransferase n=1 Tax=Methyloceanibacter sp. TaxID=1965321 RepID=UPI003D6D4C00